LDIVIELLKLDINNCAKASKIEYLERCIQNCATREMFRELGEDIKNKASREDLDIINAENEEIKKNVGRFVTVRELGTRLSTLNLDLSTKL
jgi:hypothetical protein